MPTPLQYHLSVALAHARVKKVEAETDILDRCLGLEVGVPDPHRRNAQCLLDFGPNGQKRL